MPELRRQSGTTTDSNRLLAGGMSGVVYSVYMLRCADDSLYTGIATDVARRIAEHQTSARGAKYLRGRGPLRLVFAEEVGDRSMASKIESHLKSLAKAEKEVLVTGGKSLADVIAGLQSTQASGSNGA